MAQAGSTDSTNLPIPERPQESFYLPTDISPEEVFKAIGRLRKEARDEIDRLIRFLDKTDDYVSRELEDAVDDGPIDDNELDGPENGEDELSEPDEPSLGSIGDTHHYDQERWATGGRRDLELDDCDEEDSDPAEESEASGIGDYDGLAEQVGSQEWQHGGQG